MSDSPETIEFVNQKSVERVSVLVKQLRDAFSKTKPPFEESKADSVLSEMDKNPLFAFTETPLLKFPMEGEAAPKFENPLEKIQHLSFYSPTTLPKDIYEYPNDKLNRQKREFLIGARKEHHRMMWAFQDRLVFDAASKENSGYTSPFKTAAKLLSEEADIHIQPEAKPPTNQPENKSAPPQQNQGKYASLLRKTQESTNEVLETQLLASKMLCDREKYRALHGVNITEEQSYYHDLPVVNPFPIIAGNESTK